MSQNNTPHAKARVFSDDKNSHEAALVNSLDLLEDRPNLYTDSLLKLGDESLIVRFLSGQ